MCGNCGCSKVGDIAIHTHSHQYSDREAYAERNREHSHHHHEHNQVKNIRSLTITQSILSKNDRLAERNRGYFLAKGLLVLNRLVAE
jgi:hydrogenase nickel incorporation protein HypB